VIPRIRPDLDPLAQRSAIQALEAQRAAYARYARSLDGHRSALAGGDGDTAIAAAAAAETGYGELAEGARRLGPLLDAARAGGTPQDRDALQRQLDAMMEQAHAAETAIQNLTRQLEVWHAAYARQLAEVGVVAGAGGSGNAPAARGAAGVGGAAYDRRGPAGERPAAVRSLIDRRG
jgi:hypothetical protein